MDWARSCAPALYAFGTEPGIMPVSAHAGDDRTRARRIAAQRNFNYRIGYLLFTRPDDFSIVRQSGDNRNRC